MKVQYNPHVGATSLPVEWQDVSGLKGVALYRGYGTQWARVDYTPYTEFYEAKAGNNYFRGRLYMSQHELRGKTTKEIHDLFMAESEKQEICI